MASSTKSPQGLTEIPAFYRVFFTTVDPLLCLWAAYMDFFTPDVVLSSHIPFPSSDEGHRMLLAQRGGLLLCLGFLSAVLLRFAPDIRVWHILEVGLLVSDFAYFWAAGGVLRAQGRLWPEAWRGEDWGSLGVTGLVTLVRLGFLARVGGFGEGEVVEEGEKKRN
ncbi:hypothetical protein B5807_01713 [Epicoccum nigrum]|jgi:hypothetical protein|uniref:DUF7704 domain-containing protein n=1 Tax=Epicoccum nigrum TaxID=105696 RepID=A0A1Y2MG33_EPING|nr:hypothetical protein B5807_01713 [Epicoccum nigrum]